MPFALAGVLVLRYGISNAINWPFLTFLAIAGLSLAILPIGRVAGFGDMIRSLIGSTAPFVLGFALAPRDGVEPGELEYQAVLGQGWLSPWAEGGQFCGSRGMSLPILGLRVRLRGQAAERFEAAVTATFLDGSTVGPVLDGAVCESGSLAPLEAFRVALQPRAPIPLPGRRRRKPR